MDVKLSDKIFNFWQTCGFAVEKYSHRPIESAADAIRLRKELKIENSGSSKSLLMIAKDKPFLIVTLGDSRAPAAKKFRQYTGSKDARFATSEEAARHTQGVFGSLPPIGCYPADMPIFVDRAIFGQPYFCFTPADPEQTFKVKTVDLIKAYQEFPVFVFDEKTITPIK